MNIKLAALDLDGTTLDNSAQLSNENKQAIQAAAEKGVTVVPCTGRTIAEMPIELMHMPQIRYCILANGAKVLQTAKSQVLFSDCLDRKIAGRALELALRYTCMCELYMDGKVVVEQAKLSAVTAYGVTPRLKTLVEQTRTGVKDLKAYFENSGGQVEKLNIFFGDLSHRERFLKDVLIFGQAVEVTGSMESNAEINSKTATKGNALKRLTTLLGMQKEQVMAIGDSGNDISMLQYAGVPLAVRNADKNVRQIAKEVLPANHENAVAYALKKYILQR